MKTAVKEKAPQQQNQKKSAPVQGGLKNRKKNDQYTGSLLG